jgi:hypothetical protein
VEFKLYYKYAAVYREVFSYPRTECCQLVNATEKTNNIAYWIIRNIKAMAPDLIHDCPYSVRVLQNQKVCE